MLLKGDGTIPIKIDFKIQHLINHKTVSGTYLTFSFVSKKVVYSVAKNRILFCLSMCWTKLGKIDEVVFDFPIINELNEEDFKLKQIVINEVNYVS